MSIFEHALLRAYLDGDLDESESQAFELLLLERPDLAEIVESDTALRIGLEASSAAVATSVAGGSGPEGDVPTRVTRAGHDRSGVRRHEVSPRRPRSPWMGRIAASAVLVVVGFAGASVLRTPGRTTSPATLAYVDKTRGLADVVEIALPADGALVMLVPVPTPSGCTSVIEIRQAGARALQADAHPDAYGYAGVVVGEGALVGGDAEVMVTCAGQETARYDVRFVLPGPKS